MPELTYWKYQDETQKVLKEIKDEITRIQGELVEGSLLSQDSNWLARSYARQIGKLEGLQYIERIFELDKQEESND